MDRLTAELFDRADKEYADFTAKLNPGVPRESIIGVRFPDIRDIVKRYSGTEDAAEFMSCVPHRYFDQNNLHSALISIIKDPAAVLEEIERFLPFVDNWATCDTISPKCMKKALPAFFERIEIWIRSDRTYTVRFAIVMLMNFFLNEAFDKKHPAMVAGVKSEEYYVRMAAAWYFATALAKRYDEVIPYFENKMLDKWTHNKAIRKAEESYRVTDEHKAYLKTLKIK